MPRSTGCSARSRPAGGRPDLRRDAKRAVGSLAALLRFPSISADPARINDSRRCAEWLVDHLRRIGLEGARLIEVGPRPLVYAEWRKAASPVTLLIYGHYDVQPVDPLAAWKSPPFEPRLEGEYLYARGASDDKGQLFVHLEAIRGLLASAGRLPVNVVCLFEGEEETGSVGLQAWLLQHGKRLGVDVAVVSDSSMRGRGKPAITYALRGVLGLELSMIAPRPELHSGVFGGTVANPLSAVVCALSSLHQPSGRLAIDGFYDPVRDVGREERREMERVGPGDPELLTAAGTTRGHGEPGYTLYERATIRPALTITGMGGGYQGPGGKAVIPAHAFAKLDVRLVPDQKPRQVARRIARQLSRVVPRGIRWRLRILSEADPVVIDRSHPAVAAGARALRSGFGVSPAFVRSGGTVPIVSLLTQCLGIPVVMMGFGLPDDAIHAPNERFHLPTFFRGIASARCFIEELAQGPV